VNGMIIGQFIPGDSFWHRIDPRAKIILASTFIISCFLIHSWIFMFVMVGLELIAMLLTKLPYKFFINNLKPILFFVFITVFFQMLFTTEGHLILNLGFFQITDIGLSRGLFMALRLIIVVIVSMLLTSMTKPSDLTLALESLLKPLKKMKFPVSELALMTSIALRFVPTLFGETQKILKSQASRGVDITEGKFKEKIAQLISLLVPLFILSFRRSDELANAMEVRGYIPGKFRTSINLLRWKQKDTFIIVLSAIILTASIIF